MNLLDSLGRGGYNGVIIWLSLGRISLWVRISLKDLRIFLGLYSFPKPFSAEGSV